jgi:hypothetical protein
MIKIDVKVKSYKYFEDGGSTFFLLLLIQKQSTYHFRLSFFTSGAALGTRRNETK